MSDHIILGVHITDRMKEALEVQSLFTEYGQHIKTRIGLHEVESCSQTGVIILELYGDEAVCGEFASKLGNIEGVEVQKIVFTH